MLLMDAIPRTHDFRAGMGLLALVVDAIGDATRALYERAGFNRFVDDEYRLFLPMDRIRQMIAASE